MTGEAHGGHNFCFPNGPNKKITSEVPQSPLTCLTRRWVSYGEDGEEEQEDPPPSSPKLSSHPRSRYLQLNPQEDSLLTAI